MHVHRLLLLLSIPLACNETPADESCSCNRPTNSCKDESVLLDYSVSECRKSDCVYTPTERVCELGCVGQSCVTEPCLNVLCDSPPANTCSDTMTVLEYEAEGTCNPSTGACDYASAPRGCDVACTNGRCTSDPVAWGFVELMEKATPYYGDAAWVRAYFALEPHFFVAPERRLDLRCEPILQEGECILYSNCTLFDQLCLELCAPDEECVWQPPTAGCVVFTLPWHPGEMTITGLKSAVNVLHDDYGRYDDTSLAADIFDSGDTITASFEGGDLAPFTISAAGVAPLVVADTTVPLDSGVDTTLSWTPADASTRILTFLALGWHTPNAPDAAILCDSPDTTGEVVVSGSLVDEFLARYSTLNRQSYIIRYTQRVEQPFGDDIEMTVGSVQYLDLVLP